MRRRSAQGTLSVWAAVAGLWLVVIVAWATQLGLDKWVAHTRQQGAAADYWRERDPSPGTEVVLPKKDMYGQAILREDSTTEDVLLIVAGSCTGCTKSKFKPEKLNTSRFSQIIVMFTSQEEEVRQAGFKFPHNVRVLAGFDAAQASALNAYFTPRFYLLDRGLRVRRLQNGPADSPYWHREAITHSEENK